MFQSAEGSTARRVWTLVRASDGLILCRCVRRFGGGLLHVVLGVFRILWIYEAKKEKSGQEGPIGTFKRGKKDTYGVKRRDF